MSGRSDSEQSDGPQAKPTSRRSFTGALIGFGTAAVALVLSVPLFRFAFYPVFQTTAETAWSDAGDASDQNSMTAPVERAILVQRADGWRMITARQAIYELPASMATDGHRVLSPVCPHMGCEVAWVSAQRQFRCPCHESVFAEDGSYVSGPAPRGLDYLDSEVRDGRLMVLYQSFRQLVSKREVIG